MLFKITVAIPCAQCAGCPYFQSLQMAVVFGNEVMYMNYFRALLIKRPDIMVMDGIKTTVFQRLQVEEAFLLIKETFIEHNRVIFLHKPCGNFSFIAVVKTTH